MEKRNAIHSPRLVELKKQRRRNFLNKILVIFFAFIVVLAALAYFSHLRNLNISEIEVTGNRVIESEQIKQVVNEELAQNYFWLIPKTNFLFYPKNKIKSDLVAAFERLKNISLKVDTGNVLQIDVSERQARYTWCGENLPDVSVLPKDIKCSFMDENGYIFDTAPYFSGTVYFKFFGPTNNSVFLPGIFTKVVAFKDALIQIGLKPISLIARSGDDIEIDLAPDKKGEPSPQILVKDDFDPTQTPENLQAALSTDPLQSEFKNKYSSLLYIDLRYGNKVYYKFR